VSSGSGNARSSREIGAVVFDMDGVLIDSEPLWREVERDVAATVGVALTDAELVDTMGVRIQDVVGSWHQRSPWESPPVEEIVERVSAGVERAVGDRGAVLPGAVEAVEYAAGLGLRLAVASSSSMPMIRAVVDKLGMGHRFEVLHSADSERAGKPAPDVYLGAAARLGVPPTACVAVEDSRNGVLAALAAGMWCVAVPEQRPEHGTFHGAHVVLGSLEEFDDRLWPALGVVSPRPMR
jgi:beta-phosphoglucomutase-like phosphatase (HAD superfamily)